MTTRFYQSISSLTHAIRDASEQRKIEFEWFRSHWRLASRSDLKEMERLIMDTIKNFADRQNAHNDRQAAAIQDVSDDVKGLLELVEKLKAGIGPISDENKAILAELEARSEKTTTDLEALAALTPPEPPVEEPPTEPEA